MRRLGKIARHASIAVVGVVALLLLALLSVRAYHQQANAPKFAIQSPHGIRESGYVRIGGIEQWLQIRGQDRDNPVLLCLHGGPGASWIALTEHFIPWERQFTVVLWDQRGAGKTLGASGASIAGTMSVDRMTRDGIEVAEHLRQHLHKDKLVLLGHSWGSILGINMVKRRPDLFAAYVGTGQASDMPAGIAAAYARLQDEARAAGDQGTLKLLAQIGQPPFASREKIEGFFNSVDAYLPASDRTAMQAIRAVLIAPGPDDSLRDEFDRARGFKVVPPMRLYDEMLTTRLGLLGPHFDVPMFFIQGGEDRLTPAALAQAYFQTIDSPHKEMVVLEGGGHFAFLSMGDRFLAELVSRVRPMAMTR